jgi:hypothetical protein
MKQVSSSSRLLTGLLVVLLSALSLPQANAQNNPCAIPGYPGCTSADFNRAMQQQQNQNDYQQQLQLQRRNNQLLQEQNDMMRQQQYQNQFDNINRNQQMQGQRCLSMPLGTPGC